MLMISQSSMFTAQSGPISMSLVALSAHATAAIALGGRNPPPRTPPKPFDHPIARIAYQI
uniref:Uncharacterized protein n=1 Tax=Arundo donax TaxID=35708 RepID=A0A0A9E9U0_ARUDO